jgi:integral membrane protein
VGSLLFELFLQLTYSAVMLRIFQQGALWEAITTVFLFFVAMPLKYFADVPEAVRIAGSIHGFLVVIFVVLLVVCWQSYNWTFGRAIKYLVLSVIPIVSFWIERDLKREIRAPKQRSTV